MRIVNSTEKLKNSYSQVAGAIQELLGEGTEQDQIFKRYLGLSIGDSFLQYFDSADTNLVPKMIEVVESAFLDELGLKLEASHWQEILENNFLFEIYPEELLIAIAKKFNLDLEEMIWKCCGRFARKELLMYVTNFGWSNLDEPIQLFANRVGKINRLLVKNNLPNNILERILDMGSKNKIKPQQKEYLYKKINVLRKKYKFKLLAG